MSKSPAAIAPLQLVVGEGPSVHGNAVTFGEIVTALRENLARILTIAALMAMATASLAAVLPRFYDSQTRIRIDPRGIQATEKDLVAKGNSAEQATMLVESEMRVLTSDSVLAAIVKREKLDQNPEFNGEMRTFSRFIETIRVFGKSLFSIQEESTPSDLEALRYLQKAVKSRREPQSYVIDLTVTTRDAKQSQRIAEGIAKEYMLSSHTTISSATERASRSMTGRLAELQRAAVTAEDAVERYKRENDIVGASGKLVNEQQLGELNSQLVIARNDAAKALDLLEQLNRLRRAGVEPDALPEALRSETMARLRAQYAAIRRREASLSVSVLPGHPNLKQSQRELSDTRRLITEELQRIAENTRLEAERAKTNERALERSFEDLKKQASSTNERSVRLRQLEREAEAARAVYAAMLARTRELDSTGGVDTTLVSVISPAILPKGPKPPTMIHLLALGSLGGFSLGLFGAVRRLRADPRLRSEAQMGSIAGGRRFLVVPGLTDAVRLYRRATSGQAAAGRSDIPLFFLTNQDAPASIGIARVAAEISPKTREEVPQIVLFTAAGDYEGKSTIAANVAIAAASAGDSVLLIDADLRERSLSKLLLNGPELVGFCDIVSGRVDVTDAIVKRGAYPIDIMAAGGQCDLRSAKIASTIIGLAKTYDVVIIDGGVLTRDRLVTELAFAATSIALVAREGVTLRADYQTVLEALDRGGKVRPLLLTDA